MSCIILLLSDKPPPNKVTQHVTAHSTIDEKDRARFDALGAEWWDPQGAMKPLHLFAPVRLEFITSAVRRAGLTPATGKALAGLSVLDIGCGGGILAEPMARMGADVTGLDGSSEATHAASTHAASQGLEIRYLNQTSEELAKTGAQFDVITASEVIEHVADRALFLRAMSDLLRPGGVAVLTTINRNLAAFALAKVAAEYILRLVPAGTHDPRQFVKPRELQTEAAAVGLDLNILTGFVPLPDGTFKMAPITAVNYGLAGTKRSR